MKRICTIAARAGSRGVKNKNIKMLAGKPLIAYTIIQAQDSKMFDVIAVTSDSEEILEVAKTYGVKFLIKRPDELATNVSAKVPALHHCVNEVEKISGEHFDTMVDLDATSPLRTVDDIKNAILMLETYNVSNVITGCIARRSPYFNLVELNENGYVGLSKQLSKPIVRRQDSPKCYDMNASIYVWKRDAFFKDTIFNHDTMIYEMPEERSIDIDNPLDFEFVEFLINKRGE